VTILADVNISTRREEDAMPYEIYVNHPESFQRREEDFASWSLWAPQHAPWTGVGISEQAKLLQAACAQPMLAEACEALDVGGELTATATRDLLRLPSALVSEKVREVLVQAVQGGYGVRVVFSKGFGSISASAYLEKHGSA
jgi:hypothetical protein